MKPGKRFYWLCGALALVSLLGWWVHFGDPVDYSGSEFQSKPSDPLVNSSRKLCMQSVFEYGMISEHRSPVSGQRAA